ncbi:uncharacterized protein LOC111707082 [Eurytemora carolleeae]|uniref:uncharacterized protein LOC111707082 n=1 Tax=Eurytemora carolleeae TaxID=1294199 RepID=UPI000C75EFF0|nr:uncharacterized protein LOC111707082 [Eurytemora carolleeae]|eukprot:XP_023335848.1 uncharacterized protein LOC111707082 [Eurytemora affinis]
MVMSDFYLMPYIDVPRFSDIVQIITRSRVLDSLSQSFKGFGLNGASCVQRLICEINSTPLKMGLLGDILNTIFLGEIEKSYNTFYSAQKVGRSKKSCKAYSAECPVSIFNFPSAFKSFIP